MARKSKYDRYSMNTIIHLIRETQKVSGPNHNVAGACKEYFHEATFPMEKVFTFLNSKKEKEWVVDECFGRTALAQLTLNFIKEGGSDAEISEKLKPYLIKCYVPKITNYNLRSKGPQKKFLLEVREGKTPSPENFLKEYKRFVEVV